MSRHLHLVRSDSSRLAAATIQTDAGRAGADVTVVLLDDTVAPTLPPGARVLTLGQDGLDYAGLLDLIFESDHVISW